MTAQITVGPHSTSSLIRSDSVYETGKITLNGDLGTALQILNNSVITSDGDATFDNITATTQITANNIVILDDNNTIKIGKPSHTTNKNYPDLGSTTWTTNIGLGLTNDMVIPDAINELEQWKYSLLVDTPPPVILGSVINDPDKLNVQWTFHPVIDVGFADINLPHHTSVFFQYVKTSLNPLNDFSDGSVVTINTGSKDTNELFLYIDSGSSSLIGNAYHEYGDLDGSTSYDLRIYLKNYNETFDIKYVDIGSFITGNVGVPTAPLNGVPTTIDSTTISLDWDEPIDHNILEAGNNTLPFIDKYNITYSASTSLRYGGVFADSGTTSTASIGGANSDSDKILDTLLSPGTTYNLNIKAVNKKNPGESAALSFSGFTDYPSFPNTFDSYTLALNPAVYAPFSAGGYNLSASQFYNYIVNYNNLDGTLDNQLLEVATTDPILLNEVVADSSTNPLTTVSFLGGIQGSAAGPGKNLFAFGGALSNGEYVAGDITMGITNDGDYHSTSGASSQGFWRSADFYGRGDHTTLFLPTDDIYEFYFIQIMNPSTSNKLSNHLVFAIDNINIAPSISNSGIYGIYNDDSNMISFISGVPTYNNTVIFMYRSTISEIGNNYLRGDLEHYEVQISDNTTEIGDIQNILQSDIGGSHKYYDEPGSPWALSVALHNTSGLVLEPVDQFNPRVNIQFNDFGADMSGVGANYYTEDLKLKFVGKNLYGDSSSTFASYVNSSGISQPLRIDFYSINNDISNNSPTVSYGQRVNSGDTEFPNVYEIDFGLDFDNTQNIITDTGYTEELQLVNGVYHTPSNSSAFLNYSNYFYPTVLSITTPDYSTAPTSGYRYVTFKYTRSFTGYKNKLKITLINPVGLTVDFTALNLANHKLYIRLQDTRTLNPGDYTYSTNWLSASDAFGCMGVNNAASGEGCLITNNSTLTVRDCLMNPFLEDVIFYVKLGLDSSQDHSIENIQLDLI